MDVRTQALVALALVTLAGCDPCRTVQQELEVEKVRHRQSLQRIKTLEAKLSGSGKAARNYSETIDAIEAKLKALGAMDRRLAQLSSSAEEGMQGGSTRAHLVALADDLKQQIEERDRSQRSLEKALASAKRNASGTSRATRRRLRELEERYEARLAEASNEYTRQLQILQLRITELETTTTQQAGLITRQEKTIEHLNETITRGRYVAGRIGDLRRSRVLVGRRWSRKTGDCDACPDCFQSVNTGTRTSFDVPAASFTLFTTHPRNSYRKAPVDSRNSRLWIVDTALFWRDSKCLVIGY